MSIRLAAVFVVLLVVSIPCISPGSGPGGAGIEEKTGSGIPRNIFFFDEGGERLALASLLDRPAVISLVYHGCQTICPRLLGGLAVAAAGADLDGGSYRLITVSFDETDTPALAADRKRNYTAAAGRPLSANSWRFLTGDQENIRRLTDAVGFSFRPEGKGFEHPRVLVVMAPGGRIVRYLDAAHVKPLDITMAVTEAAGPSVFEYGGVLLYCFRFAPEEGGYVFDGPKVLMTVAAAFLLIASAMVLFHQRYGRRSLAG